jgi:hypothetical protein
LCIIRETWCIFFDRSCKSTSALAHELALLPKSQMRLNLFEWTWDMP